MATPAVPAHDGGPPPDAPVQQAMREREPSLKEGFIQPCQGYLRRRSKILRRWKKEWLDVVPGMYTDKISAALYPDNGTSLILILADKQPDYVVWGPDVFLRGGRGKRERDLETLAALLLESQ